MPSSSSIVSLNPTPTNLQPSITVFSSRNVSTNRLRGPFTDNSDVKISVLKLSAAFNTIKQDHGLDKISADRAYASHLLLLRRSFSKQAGGGHWEFLLCLIQEHCTATSVIVRSSLTLWYAKQHVRKCPYRYQCKLKLPKIDILWVIMAKQMEWKEKICYYLHE